MPECTKKTNVTQSDNFKSAMCYVPFGAIIIFLIETKKSTALRKNIKYGVILLVGYLILQALLYWFLGIWIFIFYVLISIYFGLKAYNGDSIDIDYFDDFESKLKDMDAGSEKK